MNDRIVVKVETIDVTRARDLLARNARNRRVSPVHVAKLARDMAGGHWQFNSSPISVSPTGDLVDGQHRLHAVVRSGVAIKTLVAYGFDESTRLTTDIGRTIGGGSIFGICGEKNTSILSAATSMLLTWESGSRAPGAYSKGAAFSSAEMRSAVERNPGLRDSAALASRTFRGLAPSVTCFCHYLFSRIDSAAADRFIADLIDGAGMEANDPVFRLREAILLARGQRRAFLRGDLIAIFIRAWNARAEGRTLQRLQRFHSKEDAAIPEISSPKRTGEVVLLDVERARKLA